MAGMDTQAEPPIRCVERRIVYSSPWMSVREDLIELADGSRGTFGVVDKPDFAVIIAEQNGCFHLVEQFRYPTGQRSWEFPMGGWPAGKSGSALELAQAELAEETGVRAASWDHLGHLTNSNGFCNQRMDVFHATELTTGAPDREKSEADMVHAVVTEQEFRQMIKAGRITDSETVCAYGLLRLRRDD